MGALFRFALTMALWVGQGCPDAFEQKRPEKRDNHGEESARHEYPSQR